MDHDRLLAPNHWRLKYSIYNANNAVGANGLSQLLAPMAPNISANHWHQLLSIGYRQLALIYWRHLCLQHRTPMTYIANNVVGANDCHQWFIVAIRWHNWRQPVTTINDNGVIGANIMFKNDDPR